MKSLLLETNRIGNGNEYARRYVALDQALTHHTSTTSSEHRIEFENLQDILKGLALISPIALLLSDWHLSIISRTFSIGRQS